MESHSALHSASWQCIYRVQRALQSLTRFFFRGATALSGPGPPHSWSHFSVIFIPVSKTPLDDWSTVLGDLTTHNTHERQTLMPSEKFEPTMPANQLPQTHALERASTWIGQYYSKVMKIKLVQERKGSRDNKTEGERERQPDKDESVPINGQLSHCGDKFLCWRCGKVILHSGHSATFLFEWYRSDTQCVLSDTELQVSVLKCGPGHS